MILLVASLVLAGEIVVAPSPGPWTNALAAEKSPFLVAHGDNPVAWQRYGPGALEEARRRQVPILVAVGHGACSPCWEMERTVFAEPGLAATLNQGFVAVMVDRDEDPGLDLVLRDAAVTLGAKDGWPLTVFLTPEGQPFQAGNSYGLVADGPKPSFGTVVNEVLGAWRAEGPSVVAKAADLKARLDKEARRGSAGGLPDNSLQDKALVDLRGREDPVYRGFDVEKRLRGPTLWWLADRSARGDALARELAGRTFEALAMGALRDHLGGGVFVMADEAWKNPNTAKSLAENAELIAAATAYDALGVGPAGLAKTVAEEAATALVADLDRPDGGFWDGLLASPWTYSWTPQQLAEVVPYRETQQALVAAWGIEKGGVPWLSSPLPDALHRVTRSMSEARKLRARPAVVGRRSAAANGLAISAVALWSGRTGDKVHLPRLRAAAKVILGARDPDGTVRHDLDTGSGRGDLADQALVAQGLLDLYEVDPRPEWLDAAITVTKAAVATFSIPSGGFHQDPGGLPGLSRRTLWDEEAVVGGQGTLLLVISRLQALGVKDLPADAASKALGRARRYLEGNEAAVAYPTLLRALDVQTHGVVQIAVGGPLSDPLTQALLGAARSVHRPGSVLLWVDPDGPPALPLAEGKTSATGQAWVCHQGVCTEPMTEPESLARAIKVRIAPD